MQKSTALCVAIKISILCHVQLVICLFASIHCEIIKLECFGAVGLHDIANTITNIRSVKTITKCLAECCWEEQIYFLQKESRVYSVMESEARDPFKTASLWIQIVGCGCSNIDLWSHNLARPILGSIEYHQ